MKIWKGPFFRVGLVILAIILLAWMPSREFLKITFMLGIPFIFILGFMLRRKRYSVPWLVSLVLLIGVLAGYGYLLSDLPQRIETKRIVSNGAALVAEGKYDQAIKEYRNLEDLGRSEKAKEKIAFARKEKNANIQLTQAKAYLENGKPAEAKKILEKIPADTRAGREAKKLLD